MKCTDKRKPWIAVSLLALLALSGCGGKAYELERAYDVYGTQIHYKEPENMDMDAAGALAYFAKNLCVAQENNIPAPDSASAVKPSDAQKAEAAGAFHLKDKKTAWGKNIYERLYPASTTKILTAYIALKYGKLTDVVTVSAQAADQLIDSSVCGIRAGDQVTLEVLLYGLMLKSGNDAADAIAEYISGDEETFAALMNQEAAALGATRSHFVNPHGLQDENHYTCVYDLYLIFQAALGYPEFENIIKTESYTASYQDADGLSVTQEWETTNLYLIGEAVQPDGVSVIGGKTGTTTDAGYCLVLYSETEAAGPVITIVLKAEDRDSLYGLMSKLLAVH